jgi:hypothetical protein
MKTELENEHFETHEEIEVESLIPSFATISIEVLVIRKSFYFYYKIMIFK